MTLVSGGPDLQLTTRHVRTVQTGDRCLGGGVWHLDEAESPGFPRVSVGDDRGRVHLPELAEHALQIGRSDTEREVPDIDRSTRACGPGRLRPSFEYTGIWLERPLWRGYVYADHVFVPSRSANAISFGLVGLLKSITAEPPR